MPNLTDLESDINALCHQLESRLTQLDQLSKDTGQVSDSSTVLFYKKHGHPPLMAQYANPLDACAFLCTNIQLLPLQYRDIVVKGLADAFLKEVK